MAVAGTAPLEVSAQVSDYLPPYELISLEKGINRYLASLDQCVRISTAWPAKAGTNTNTYRQLEGLTDAGLLTMEISGKTAIFTPSSMGKAIFLQGERGQQLCVPAPTVMKIIRTTFIAESGADRITEVRFSYSIRTLPAWAKNEKVKKAFPFIGERTEGQMLTETQYFHKAANSWEVVRDDSSAFFGDTIKPMRPM